MSSSALSIQAQKEYEELKRTETTQASEAMFSVLKELGQGRPPRTTDISRAIDRINAILAQEERGPSSSASSALPIPSTPEKVVAGGGDVGAAGLDDTGRRFLANTRNVLEQSKNLLQQRSQDDQIQSFLYHTVVSPKQIAGAATTSLDEESRKKLQEAQQSLRAIGFHGRKVILLLARSPEFRDAINTLISIAQRLLGKSEFRQNIVQAAKDSTAVAFGASTSGSSATSAREAEAEAGGVGVETVPPRAVESVTSTLYRHKGSERGKGVAPGASFLLPVAPPLNTSPVDIPIEDRDVYERAEAEEAEEEGEEFEYEYEEEEEEEEIVQHLPAASRPPIPPRSDINTTQREVRYAYSSKQPRLVPSSGALAGSESQSPSQSVTATTTTASASTGAATVVGGGDQRSVSSKLSQQVQQEIDEDTRKRLQANAIVILRTLAANPDQKLALQSLLQLVSLASSYNFASALSTPMDAAAASSTTTTATTGQPAMAQVAEEGKEVLSRFADMAVLNSLVHNLRVFITEVRDDEESRHLFDKIRRYVEQTLEEPQLLDEVWYRQKASRLLDKVGAWGQRYRQHEALDAAMADWRLLLDGISHDQQLNEFSVALKRWTEDVTYLDTKGRRHLNAALVAQLRSVFLPIMIEQFHYIPIPAITGSNDTYDWEFENILFSGYDLLPEHIFVDTESHTNLKPLSDLQHEMVDSAIEGQGGRTTLVTPSTSTQRRHHKFGRLFTSPRSKEQGSKDVVGGGASGDTGSGGGSRRNVHWPPREKLAPGTTYLSSKTTNHPGPVLNPRGHWRTTGQLVVRAYNIQLAMKNIKFLVRRKAFPRTEQSGLVDVNTKGSKGCKVIIRLDLTSDNMLNTGMFSGGAAEVSLARLAIRIHDSKHNFLLNALAKLISGAIRKRIQQTITENMSEGVKKVLEAINNAVIHSPGFAQGIVSALTPNKISPLTQQASQLAGEAFSSSAAAPSEAQAPPIAALTKAKSKAKSTAKIAGVGEGGEPIVS